MSDETMVLRALEEAVLRAIETGTHEDIERAFQRSGFCSDPKLKMVMAGVLHGATKLQDVLSIVTHNLNHEECA